MEWTGKYLFYYRKICTIIVIHVSVRWVVCERIMYSLLLKLTSIAFILLSLSYIYSTLLLLDFFSVLLLENNVYYIILLYSFKKRKKNGKSRLNTKKEKISLPLISEGSLSEMKEKLYLFFCYYWKVFPPSFLCFSSQWKTIIFILVMLKENLHKSTNKIFRLFLSESFQFLFCFICKLNLITHRNHPI